MDGQLLPLLTNFVLVNKDAQFVANTYSTHPLHFEPTQFKKKNYKKI
jgi:hypothetical protein